MMRNGPDVQNKPISILYPFPRVHVHYPFALSVQIRHVLPDDVLYFSTEMRNASDSQAVADRDQVVTTNGVCWTDSH